MYFLKYKQIKSLNLTNFLQSCTPELGLGEEEAAQGANVVLQHSCTNKEHADRRREQADELISLLLLLSLYSQELGEGQDFWY